MSNPMLWIPYGIPGSGKSTLASEWLAYMDECGRDKKFDVLNAIVSTDVLRDWMTGFRGDQSENRAVFAVAKEITFARIRSGLDVWVDATNLNSSDQFGAVDYASYAEKHSYDVVSVVMSTPFDVCRARNIKRSNPVPDNIMDRMENAFRRLDTLKLPGLVTSSDDLYDILAYEAVC